MIAKAKREVKGQLWKTFRGHKIKKYKGILQAYQKSRKITELNKVENKRFKDSKKNFKNLNLIIKLAHNRASKVSYSGNNHGK